MRPVLARRAMRGVRFFLLENDREKKDIRGKGATESRFETTAVLPSPPLERPLVHDDAIAIDPSSSVPRILSSPGNREYCVNARPPGVESSVAELNDALRIPTSGRT